MRTPLPAPDIHVARRSESTTPVDNRRLRRLVDTGAWVRLAPGAYARSDEWQHLSPIERHRVRVHETARRLRTGAVFGLHAAAAMFDLDVLGPWPDLVDVVVDRATGGRSSGGVRRHALGLSGRATVQWRHHWVTTPAQTALDIARTGDFVHGVCAIDQALWSRRRGGALADIAELRALHEALGPGRGHARIERALDAAASGADNVRETQARLLIVRLGFPTPRLQERRILRSGRLVYGDLFFPEHDHWCEIDGRTKYLDIAMTRGRPTHEIVLDEKARENEIRREVRGFSRLDALDVEHPRRVYDILTGDGLPSCRPRP